MYWAGVGFRASKARLDLESGSQIKEGLIIGKDDLVFETNGCEKSQQYSV